MNHPAVGFIISFLVALTIAIVCGRHQIKKKPKSNMEDHVEYPKLGRVKIHPYCCATCGKPLEHNDLVVWSEKKNGWQGKSSHAGCMVFIRHPEGHITRLNGENLHGEGNNPLPVGALVVTEEEWDNWNKVVEIIPPRA
jgi:hypothetical protein